MQPSISADFAAARARKIPSSVRSNTQFGSDSRNKDGCVENLYRVDGKLVNEPRIESFQFEQSNAEISPAGCFRDCSNLSRMRNNPDLYGFLYNLEFNFQILLRLEMHH